MKKRNLRSQSKLLVEHILAKDPISANKIFKQLIMEAEEEREDEVSEELGLDDTEEGTDVPNVESMDNTPEEIDGEETDKVVDDIVEINCQINAKVISNLFDRIAELKNSIESLGLDENSREYLKYEVTIQYYSDKLQDLQNKTNPGVDQSKVESALEKISVALEQLEGEVGGTSEEVDEVQTPEEISAKNNLGETETTEADTNGDENSETNEDAADETSEESEEPNDETSEESEESNDETSEESEKADETDDIDNLFG